MSDFCDFMWRPIDDFHVILSLTDQGNSWFFSFPAVQLAYFMVFFPETEKENIKRVG